MDFYKTLQKIENTPLLETKRLRLRKFTMSDIGAVLQIFGDKEVNTFLPWYPLETMEQAQVFLHDRFLAPYQLPSSYHFAVCLKTDDIPIGYVNISDHESHDLGYGLRKELWHKGIVTEACEAVVERIRQAGFPYLTATHDRHNPRSGEVMKKLGMSYRYSYEEQVQPKDILVTFKMYQMDFHNPPHGTYRNYWDESEIHFVE